MRHVDEPADGICTECVRVYRFASQRKPFANHRDLEWLCIGWLCDLHDAIAVAQVARAAAEYGGSRRGARSDGDRLDAEVGEA